MTHVEVGRLRLYNQRIVGPACADPAAVVRRMGAMQAQDYGQAVWAVGLRAGGATLADVERAMSDGKIVRTWPMRGTIHFVPAEDAGWMLRLSAVWMIAKDGRRQAQLGLDEAILGRCAALIRDALAGGKRLLRAELLATLEDAGIGTGSQRGYHILWYLAQTGLICLGPVREGQQAFVLLEEWAPHPRELGRDDALAELAGRYFASHGPATVHDFAWWMGSTVADAKAGLEAAKPGLVAERIEGKEYWMPAASARGSDDYEAGVHLLPGFDEYLLGYKDRSAVLAPEHAPRIVPGNNGVFAPIIVVDGQVVGTWKRKAKRSTVEVALTPFAPLGDREGRVVEVAGRYGAFVGLPASLTGTGADAPSSP